MPYTYYAPWMPVSYTFGCYFFQVCAHHITGQISLPDSRLPIGTAHDVGILTLHRLLRLFNLTMSSVCSHGIMLVGARRKLKRATGRSMIGTSRRRD